MIELLAITAAVAALIDSAHAEGPDPILEGPVSLSLRPDTAHDQLGEELKVTVSPRRAVLTQSDRSTVLVEPLAVQVMFEKRLGEGNTPEQDFTVALEVAAIVKAVEDTLWGTDEVQNVDLGVEASLSSVEEAPDEDETVGAIWIDERRVLRATVIANYTVGRSI